MSTNVAAVHAFFAALEQHDLDLVRPVLAEDVTEVIPLSPTGSTEPFAEYSGREAVLGYLEQIVTTFSRTVLVDRTETVSADGGTVFVEATGDLVNAETEAPYRNVYAFRFDLSDGLITRITEYANPVTFAQMAGIPVG